MESAVDMEQCMYRGCEGTKGMSYKQNQVLHPNQVINKYTLQPRPTLKQTVNQHTHLHKTSILQDYLYLTDSLANSVLTWPVFSPG